MMELTQYNPVRAEIEALKKLNADLVFQYETPVGNKNARSHIYKLRQHKAEVERVRKATKQEALEFGRKVDAVAAELTGELDAMIEVHRKPIEEIERREAEEKAAIERAEAERKAEAERIEREAREAALAAERAEAARVAAELAEVRRQQEVERIQREAADRARAEAEAKARAEREAVEARERAAHEARIAAERAQIEAERREAIARIDAAKMAKDLEDARAAMESATIVGTGDGVPAPIIEQSSFDRIVAIVDDATNGIPPQVATIPNGFESLAELCHQYMIETSNPGVTQAGREHIRDRIFEAAMIAVYGPKIFDLIDAIERENPPKA